MMNNLMFENKQVEVFEWNGQVLFNPKHVANCLGIKNVNDNISKMNSKQVIKLKNSDIGKADIRKLNNAGENFLTESGVYKLILKSHKVEAERFQDWVTDEVLPSIRRHGVYAAEELVNNPDLLIAVATKIKEERTARLKAEQKVIEQQKQINHKDNVIVGLVDEISLAEKRQILNRVVRYKHADYRERWSELYKQFQMKYHIDLKQRFENYNSTHKPKMKSKVEYIEKVMNKLPELYEIACKLYESDIKELTQELYEIAN
jgi:prophage antirepressor-like protein